MSIDDDIILEQMVADVFARAHTEPLKPVVTEVQEDIFDDDPHDLEDMVAELSTLFAALGNTTRMEIVAFLSHFETAAGDLARELEIPNSTLSRHLHILENAGVVRVQKDGNSRIYTLNEDLRPMLEAASRRS